MQKKSLERVVKLTNDGSKTLYINDLNESYHSHHGALQEAKHVFIDNGLLLVDNYEIFILELGFGTGLNVMVTIDEFIKNDKYHKIRYFTLEKYPISEAERAELNYSSLFHNEKLTAISKKIHNTAWGIENEIIDNFFLTKIQCDFFDLKKLNITDVDLVYYDCFGARVQPDLWEKPLFEIVSDKMKSGGLLTTYASKGSMRRILKELGFSVQKKTGPPGKREMVNAVKL